MGLLQGKLAVVTAGTAGIGRAVAARFVAEGADVVVTARCQPDIDETMAALARTSRACEGTRATSPTSTRSSTRCARRAVRSTSCSSTRARNVPATAIVDTAPEAFDTVAGLNFRGAFFTTSKIIPIMRDGATIVLTASIAAHNGGPGHAAYNATKAALRSLARTLTAELRDRRIRANAISPGPTATQGFADFFNGDEDAIARVAEQIPVGRIGRPDEIAAAVLFLASEESSFVAGAELVVDGGMSQV